MQKAIEIAIQEFEHVKACLGNASPYVGDFNKVCELLDSKIEQLKALPKEQSGRMEELKNLLNDPRTGLKDSSDTNKTRYAILAMFEGLEKKEQSVEEILKRMPKYINDTYFISFGHLSDADGWFACYYDENNSRTLHWVKGETLEEALLKLEEQLNK